MAINVVFPLLIPLDEDIHNGEYFLYLTIMRLH